MGLNSNTPELGKTVDGRVAGINLPETSLAFGESGKFHPTGFTYDGYVDGVKVIMTATRAAFPRSTRSSPHVGAGLRLVLLQDGNLEDRNPSSRNRVTVGELYCFANDLLRLDYIFWGTQEPYYSREILPYIHDLGRPDSR